ncbi:uncharacterized protein MEPE_00442 [Melanopsichium pennsylvanicum]|uniref:Nitrogen regulatory protein areA GATA-like domain-containing protein n=2 Tax=Melanopsichium pennsylvanicum TaxID=63383 RepID=A0AAJ5C2P9_9BASI|nr:conserved hypothetical protein [Melanopsichium pennsylvanicum 4]SNX81737.1 uncharacterized protein MEPE_00442 [Melanopsichium pennsylvanicum]
MPSSLPDPVLALSMDNVLKLNDLSLDQLANLWNVFTKCKESLESGRRLENLSWRLWFREAHILPPDTSLSDLTDFTPLDTPLISRTNSITGSYRPLPLIAAAAPRSESALSDPEDGNDSEYSTDSETDGDSTSATAPAPSAPTSTPIKRRVKLGLSSRPSTPSSSATIVNASASSALSPRAIHSQRIADTIAERTSRAITAASRRANLSDIDGDSLRRKRGISSSSAFGSKARVKQRNQEGASRRRPLSFQAALENLVLTSRADNFASLRGKQGSMSQLGSHLNASTGALDASSSRDTCNDAGDAERNSAPAELSPIKSSSISQAAYASQLRSALEPPASLPRPTVSPQTLGHKVYAEHCDAPETRGSLSPTKIPIALAPTIGAISRRGSQTMLSDAASREAQSSGQAEGSASVQKVMPPPQGLPEPTPAASAIKQKVQAEQTQEQQQASPAASVEEETPIVHQHAHGRVGMVRSDSASSASTQASSRSAAHAAGVRRPSDAKIKTRSAAGGLYAGHRSKSATGLHRGAKHSKSSDRIAGAPVRPAPRHNLLSGLAMTRAAPEPAPAHAVARKPVPSVAPGSKATSAVSKKAPVKFTMGSDETDSEEYEDESDDAEAIKLEPAPSAAHQAAAKSETAEQQSKDADEIVEADVSEDDDEWASDSEAEEQERRARQAAEAERRKREEEERHRSMFQKQPIRSKSAADVRLLAPQETSSIGPSPPTQPVRGLLSSLFYPDEQHSPPGQLAGRPHASAADLRTKPSLSSRRSPSEAARSPPAMRRDRAHCESSDSTTHASKSFREGGFAGLTGLKTSKSAVALPLLDTHITRSSTAGKAKHEDQQVAGGSQHSDGSGSSPDLPVAAASFGRPGSMALARLHALTSMKAHSKRNSASNATSEKQAQTHSRRHNSEADVQLAREASSRSLRLEVSPDDRDFAIASRASVSNLTSSKHRQSTPSLASRHSDQQQSCVQRDVLGSGSRSNSEGPPSGYGSQQSATTMNGPMSISRPRSSLNLPEAAAPQTPRTTRRNMLRDELSESLRQNLLWERQSRSRMMGIGAPMAPLNQPQAHPAVHRRDNVLNGNALRPLTSTGASAAERRAGEGPKPKRYSEEWGSFHHKGW